MTTWESEYSHLQPVLNFLARKGNKRVKDLDPDITEQYQVESLQRICARTFNNQLGAFKTALNKALE